jgi:outer membrane protein assembly factor BamB
VQDAACVITKERIMLVSGEGDVLWDAPLSGIMIMVPVVDGDALYLAYEDGRLERRDCTSGEVDWIRSVNIYSGFAPVCPYGGSLYVSTPQGYLMRLDAETGDIVWRIALPEGPAYSSIVPYEDTLLVDSFSYNVTVVEAETGAILDVWDTPFGMTDIFVHND